MPPARQVGWGRVWNRWVFSGWVRQAGLGEMWYFRWGMVGCGLTRQAGKGAFRCGMSRRDKERCGWAV